MGYNLDPKLSTHAHTWNIKSQLRQLSFSEWFLIHWDTFPLLEPRFIYCCSKLLCKNTVWGAFYHWSPPEHPTLLHPTYQLKQSMKRKLRRGQPPLCIPSPQSSPGQLTAPPEQAMPVSPEPYRRRSLEVALQTRFGSEMPFWNRSQRGKRGNKKVFHFTQEIS